MLGLLVVPKENFTPHNFIYKIIEHSIHSPKNNHTFLKTEAEKIELQDTNNIETNL